MNKRWSLSLLPMLLIFSCTSVNAQGERSADRARDRASDGVKKEAQESPPVPVTIQPPTTTGVRVFGDWPSSGRCDFTLSPREGYQGLPNPNCNDKISAVDVPFGMSLEICEHDGQGAKGLGKCRRFLPGLSGVGDDMNDKATSFKVENRMIGYLNSADYSPGIKLEIKSSNASNSSGNMETDGSIGYDDGWIIQRYSVTLPSYCAQAKVVEKTKAGDADWGYHILNNRLSLYLKIRARKLFGGNNWVGVEIRCP